LDISKQLEAARKPDPISSAQKSLLVRVFTYLFNNIQLNKKDHDPTDFHTFWAGDSTTNQLRLSVCVHLLSFSTRQLQAYATQRQLAPDLRDFFARGLGEANLRLTKVQGEVGCLN